MNSRNVFLCCALLAMFICQLPKAEAVTCAEEPDNADCVDCTDPINVDDAECLADPDEETTTEVTTASPGAGTETTTRRTRPSRGTRRPGGGRPGWGNGRPGWGNGRPGHNRPNTLLGSILQKKIKFLKGIKQG